MAGIQNFDREEMSLVALRAEVWGHWVFVNGDPDATPLAEQVDELTARLERGGFMKLRFVDRLQVVDWLRAGARRPRLSGEGLLLGGDVLLVRASPDEITSIAQEPGLDLHAVAKYGDEPETEAAGRAAAGRNGGPAEGGERKAARHDAGGDKQLVQAEGGPKGDAGDAGE